MELSSRALYARRNEIDDRLKIIAETADKVNRSMTKSEEAMVKSLIAERKAVTTEASEIDSLNLIEARALAARAETARINSAGLSGRTTAGSTLYVPADAVQGVYDSIQRGTQYQFLNTQEQRAATTSGDLGTGTTWFDASIPSPRILHEFAGLDKVSGVHALKGAFPGWQLPTGQAAAAEGAGVASIVGTAAGTVSSGTFGAWFSATLESQPDTIASILKMQALQTALSLDKALIGTLQTAFGTPTAAPGSGGPAAAINAAVGTVAQNTASDPSDLVLVINATDWAGLQGLISPVDAAGSGSVITAYSGARVYLSASQAAGDVTVFHPMAATYLEARPQEILSLRLPDSTGAYSIGTWVVGGYACTLKGGVAYVVL